MDESDIRAASEVFNVERIEQLVALMEEHNLNEVDLRQGKERIRLRRGMASSMTVLPAPSAAPAAAPMPPANEAAASAPADAPRGNSESTQGTMITSPMVGTYYGRPNPDAESFVKVGDVVGARYRRLHH